MKLTSLEIADRQNKILTLLDSIPLEDATILIQGWIDRTIGVKGYCRT